MKLRRRIRLPKTFTPTHATAGLPNFPAIDVFAPPDTLVMPPEGGVLVYKHYIPWSITKRTGGWTVYLQGNSGNTYFLTHFGNVRRDGRIHRFQSLGRIGDVPAKAWASHIHEGKHKGVYTP
jgi:hypothetical protein